MTWVDWLLVLTFLIVIVFLGWVFRGISSKSVEEYLLAGRSVPWWIAGISMVATTFASDTPLAVSGLTLKYGLGGNWLWWITLITFIGIAVFFAKYWRRAGVLTDVELLRLRYGTSKTVKYLRIFKAVLLGGVVNVIVLGWVIKGLEKFAEALQIDEELGISVGWIAGACVVIAVLYSWMGGLRAVVATDVIQFAIGLAVTYVLAVNTLELAGGPGKVLEFVNSRYPYVLKNLDPISAFGTVDGVLVILFLWWTHYFSDGTGYFAQRMMACRHERDAVKSICFFMLLHFVVRLIPWLVIITGGLVTMSSDLPADPELFYPVVVRYVAGTGLLGVIVVMLLSAFLSTFDSHSHWGAGYILRDVVEQVAGSRFKLSEKMKVMIARIGVLMLAFMGYFVSRHIESIASTWLLAQMIMAGMGWVHLLRWFWWRFNAYGEWAGIIASLLPSVGYMTGLVELTEIEWVAVAGLFAIVGSVSVTLLTPPVSPAVINEFVKRCRPAGLWK